MELRKINENDVDAQWAYTTSLPADKNGLTEEEYLKTYNSDAWKKPSLTADNCIRRKLKGNIYGWWTAFK
jgi:hypothetical protein